MEVTSDQDGFIGAWFEARVVRAVPRSVGYTVVYDHLIDEADESRPHEETVNVALIRPRPPRFAGIVRFALHQAVDAFHNDAWWCGVVSGVVEGEERRFKVKFAVEVCEYGAGELRPHMDWIGREWVVPESQVLESLTPGSHVPESKMAKSKVAGSPVPESQVSKSKPVKPHVPGSQTVPGTAFTKGTKVEISSDEEGFRGAWYTGTIIEPVGEKFLIEYDHLRSDDETELLKETIDPLYIRPIPPATPVNEKFKKLEEVDALYNDGWWIGVISKVLSGSGYMVYFRTTDEEMAFKHQDLRSHYDWIDGTWLQTSQALNFDD